MREGIKNGLEIREEVCLCEGECGGAACLGPAHAPTRTHARTHTMEGEGWEKGACVAFDLRMRAGAHADRGLLTARDYGTPPHPTPNPHTRAETCVPLEPHTAALDPTDSDTCRKREG